MPPVTSKAFDGNFLKQLPDQKPANDIINDIKPIKRADKTIFVPENLMLTPAARASMLVAMPMPIRHFNPMQQTVSFSSWKAS